MAVEPYIASRRKKILILVSLGGGGHKMAGESLSEILGDEYEIEINPAMHDIFKSMDFLNVMTGGNFTGEDLYNFFLRANWNQFLYWLVEGGKNIWKSDKVEKLFDNYLKTLTHLPDLIISPTPYFNSGVAKATQKWGIPFLVVPVDLDGSTYLLDFPDRLVHDNFKLALAYDDEEVRKTTLQKKGLRDDQIAVTGFPVRPECLKKHSKEEIRVLKTKFNLLPTHETVTMVMGAVGGNIIFDHVKVLSRLDPRDHGLKLQMNICVGQNQKMEQKIRKFFFSRGAKEPKLGMFILPSGLVMHLRGFTKEILELMAVSDLIISKTGGCSVNEAIYLGKKLLLDNTPKSSARYLHWEGFNVPFVQKHNLGHAFTDNQQLLMLIPSLLKYPDKPRPQLELPNFEENILKLVQQMIE